VVLFCLLFLLSPLGTHNENLLTPLLDISDLGYLGNLFQSSTTQGSGNTSLTVNRRNWLQPFLENIDYVFGWGITHTQPSTTNG